MTDTWLLTDARTNEQIGIVSNIEQAVKFLSTLNWCTEISTRFHQEIHEGELIYFPSDNTKKLGVPRTIKEWYDIRIYGNGVAGGTHYTMTKIRSLI